MLIVETIAKIRRAHFVQKRSIRSICRDFSLSRKVVRKVLRSDATEFKYEREHQPRPAIDRWRADLDRVLAENAGKVARERLTLVQIWGRQQPVQLWTEPLSSRYSLTLSMGWWRLL
jgi:hypothetical protein